MNLGGPGRLGAYVQTGHWSQRAAHEAKPWIRIHRAAQGDGTQLPLPDEWDVPPSATYCHYTSNESAEGLQFPSVPHLAGVPLIADMTADFMTRPLEVQKLGLLYASSQKNLGIAGLTVVIVARSLLDGCTAHVPAPFHYGRQAQERSKVNTPPLFAIAVAGHVCQWLVARGGLEAAGQRSTNKAELLYRLIEEDGFFSSPIDPAFRSNVSVRFHLPTSGLEAVFLAEARQNGLLHLEGHPSVGGLRASLYNLVTMQAVQALAGFMEEFERVRG
jgi:phosphoserine aminotransferase